MKIQLIASMVALSVLFGYLQRASTHKTNLELNSIRPMLDQETSAFVDSLMNLMTLKEKIGQLNLVTPGGAVTGSVVSSNVERKIKNGQVGGIFGIRGAEKVKQAQEIAVNESRLGIPLIVGMDVIHGHQTIFPIPLGLSCSWDMEMIEKTARIAAKEATADGICWNFSPMVDIARDPRWGRIAEGAGEDPFLGSAIAKAMVRGYQQDDMSAPTTMMSTVKHFANYGAAEGGRDYNTTDMSRIRMLNDYLPPYKAAVDAGVGCVMTSFNVIDYVPASGNKWLFQDILRDSWGFNGFVVTDYTSINEMIEHGLGDLKKVTADALQSGIDMDMVGEAFLSTLEELYQEKIISLEEIEKACRRILIAKEKLGLFKNPFLYCNSDRSTTDIFTNDHRAFAREVASQSFVLLKNQNNMLPLDPSTKIALIGPLADSRRNMLGTWSLSGDFKKAVTVREGFNELLGNGREVAYAKGAHVTDNEQLAKRINAFGKEVNINGANAKEMIQEAVALAQSADVVVAVMGETSNMAGESSSMAHIGLQPSQRRLLEALKKTGKPVVLVLYNGRPMTLTWENENMDAILDVWFGGTEGGRAVADVIFGKVNPSGKLTTSFPVHVGQIPVYHSVLRTGRPDTAVSPQKFRTNYLDIPNDPLYPFGFGLSYTSFSYGPVQLSSQSLTKTGKITASVRIKNTGAVKGQEIVQLYIQDIFGSISRPIKELKGFQKIELNPGEEKTVLFEIDESLLRFYDGDLSHHSEMGEFNLFIGPNSRDIKPVKFELK
jgi:beta-glucosidase